MQERALYQTMNMLKLQNQRLIGFFWAPAEKEKEIFQLIVRENEGTKIEPYDEHKIEKPTYFKIPEFVYVFQLITDTYGVPSYQEANPSFISIVTFPFLFGMMFGDFGHGFIIFVISSILILFNNQLKGGMLDMILPTRYFFFLLGLFASYSGLLYNEFFSIPLNVFPSCYGLEDK